jgi:DNA-binding NtrC family response regulator
MQTILIVDDNDLTLLHLSTLLESRFRIVTANTKSKCLDRLHSTPVHMILLDLNMPDVKNLDLLYYVNENFPMLPIIIVSSDENPNIIVKCLKIGAKHYVFKSKINESLTYLIDIINEVFEESSEKRKKEFILPNTINCLEIIPSREYELAIKSSKGGLNLVINGETGTGKSFLVSKIHQEIASNAPLICINCASICETLVESELFGYEKGAFTGAESTKIGKIEAANGGILFLDEIGKMPKYVQEKLLTVIENKQFYRVGSSVPIHVEFQLISATNINLETLVKNGSFLPDLYYRIHQFSISLPPLRNSEKYTLQLASYFIKKFNTDYQCNFEINYSLKTFLITHSWDGNIRELKNKLQTIIAMHSQGESISFNNTPDTEFNDSLSFDIQSYEKIKLIQALKKCTFNLSKTSRLLKIPRSTLQGKMKKHQISQNKISN